VGHHGEALQCLQSKENNNSDDDVAYIYRAIPEYRKITNHWDLISDPFFNQLLKTSFVVKLIPSRGNGIKQKT
jgi:hypothetical protein